MNRIQRWMVVVLSAVAILTLTASAAAAPVPRPGGFLQALGGTLLDSRSGQSYAVDLVAREYDGQVGMGNVTLLVNGGSVSGCSAHGPGAEIDFSPGGEDFVGNNPLQDIQCGTSYGMIVHVDSCSASASLHGFAHVDAPNTPYMGPLTVDLAFQRSAPGSDAGTLSLTFYTPKGSTSLKGRFTAPIQMDTCQ